MEDNNLLCWRALIVPVSRIDKEGFLSQLDGFWISLIYGQFYDIHLKMEIHFNCELVENSVLWHFYHYTLRKLSIQY